MKTEPEMLSDWAELERLASQATEFERLAAWQALWSTAVIDYRESVNNCFQVHPEKLLTLLQRRARCWRHYKAASLRLSVSSIASNKGVDDDER